MSKADNLFKKLGYYKDFDNRVHSYRKECEDVIFEIDFWLDDKEISKSCYREIGYITIEEIGYITIEELEAIILKCKELGWIEEK